ncbi:MAG: tRNA uridine(34) hydroxylase, partial [Verrucomicrobiota bacterium]|nr:tRNA uridine(34) hydroxylase [Verrucomicrobiota bacterium]
MPEIINLSAYKFAPLADLPTLKESLRTVATAGAIKGTILLSTEGINLFVAGERAALDCLLAAIRAVPGLADLTPKESVSEQQPFRRMLVKIKREIIAFGVPGIDPARHPAPRLAPRTLKQWLDEGRTVTLLDTRNDYEVAAGTFRGALPAGIRHFRDFPQAADRLPAELKDRPVVTFCTGGIRCEKAAPYLQQAGFKQVFQLDGGILKSGSSLFSVGSG